MSDIVWIKGYEGSYSITKSGDVFYHKSIGGVALPPRQKKPTLLSIGYLVYGLCKEGKEKKYYVHRLIAEHFIDNPENKLCVNHKNGIKTDNSIENLEWVTKAENNRHGFSTGLNKGFQGTEPGELCPSSKLKEKDVLEIRNLYTQVPTKDLAMHYNVTSANIRMIINRKTWNHI